MNWPIFDTETETITEKKVKTHVGQDHELVLHNDEVNTFDWVIDSLMDVCNHDEEQAEQCALITHFKGKCGVKTGELKKLKAMCTGLHDRGLSAEII